MSAKRTICALRMSGKRAQGRPARRLRHQSPIAGHRLRFRRERHRGRYCRTAGYGSVSSPMAQAKANHADRLFSAAARGTGNAGDAEGNIGAGGFQGTFSHRGSHLFADCPVLGEKCIRYTDQGRFGGIGIGDKAGFKHLDEPDMAVMAPAISPPVQLSTVVMVFFCAFSRSIRRAARAVVSMRFQRKGDPQGSPFKPELQAEIRRPDAAGHRDWRWRSPS